MSFIFNAWYAAAWSHEVKPAQMSKRTILEQKIVLYRTSSGQAVALQDRCPHRFVPLSLGSVKDDRVECCYHGLQFDCTGACVHNPHGTGRIPLAAKVKSYPVIDRCSLLWIWMGEEPADFDKLPSFPMMEADSGYRVVRGETVLRANYVVIGENLLDLSHVPFLHEGLLGSKDGLGIEPVLHTDGDDLQVDRFMRNISVPTAFDLLFRQDGKPVDQWMNMRWNPPGAYLIDVGVHAPGESREKGVWYYGCHTLTPETSKSTRYHFAAAWPPGGKDLDPETAVRLAEIRRTAFEDQDKPILDAIQEEMGDAEFWGMKPALFQVDAAPIRMRRTVERLVAEDRAKRSGIV